MTSRRRALVGAAALTAAVVVSLVVALLVVLRDDDSGSEPFRAPIVVKKVPSTGAAVDSFDLFNTFVVDGGWTRRVAAATGIPRPAVRAYAQAAVAMERSQPDCRLGWTTLAGIGFAESRHGTFAGRTLGADGVSSKPVIGPALDGTNGVQAIRPSAQSTRWHGDDEWEHAVGSLQFLGETWARWGADADRDGRADPFDLDDAALAAGRYLCATDRDLGSVQGWNTGVFTYNQSPSYLRDVAEKANEYARRSNG